MHLHNVIVIMKQHPGRRAADHDSYNFSNDVTIKNIYLNPRMTPTGPTNTSSYIILIYSQLSELNMGLMKFHYVAPHSGFIVLLHHIMLQFPFIYT